jgi:hypothetical protein
MLVLKAPKEELAPFDAVVVLPAPPAPMVMDVVSPIIREVLVEI